jgi:hypothetical protein
VLRQKITNSNQTQNFKIMENQEVKTENRGGKREGAGPKFVYGEETINITFRIPKSRKQGVKDTVYSYLQQFKHKRSAKEVRGGEYGC